MINYFTKWIEVEVLVHVTKVKVHDFIQKSIIYHFGLPRTIVTDNEHQFNNAKFEKFYNELEIAHYLISIRYPQSNGEVETTN